MKFSDIISVEVGVEFGLLLNGQHLYAVIAGLDTLASAGAKGNDSVALIGRAIMAELYLDNEKLGNTVCSDEFRGEIEGHAQRKSERRRVFTFCPGQRNAVQK